MIPRHSKQVRLWRKALPCTISISQFVFLWTSAQSPRPRRFQQVSCLPSSASQKGAFSLRKYWSGLIFWKHVIHWGKVGLVAIRHCPLSPDSLPSQPFYWKAGAKLVAIQLGELVKAVRSSSSQFFFYFFFSVCWDSSYLNSFFECGVQKFSTERDLRFSLVSCRFDGIFGRKSLKNLGNGKSYIG